MLENITTTLDTQGKYTLANLVRDYMADPGRSRTDKTRMGYQIIFGALSEMFGPGTPVAEITREDCRCVQALLQKIPANARKLYPGLNLQQAATRGIREKRKILSPGTINSYLNNLSSLFRWAVHEGKITRSPAIGLRVIDNVHPAQKRRPFSADALQTIFTSPLYEVPFHVNADHRGSCFPGQFWVPLLGLFGGLRLSEACQLLTKDVRQIGGVWCLVLTVLGSETLGSEDRKRIKTEAGERIVPVHEQLIRMGFLQYVTRNRLMGDVRVFPNLKRGQDGYFSPFSKWFSRYLKEIGSKGSRQSFHSFRHCYRDALRRAQLTSDIIKALGGWQSGRTEDNYGGDVTSLVPTLEIAMRRVHYPGLNLAHLISIERWQLESNT